MGSKIPYNKYIGKKVRLLSSQGVKKQTIILSVLGYKNCPQDSNTFWKIYQKDFDEGKAELHERLTTQAFKRIEDPDKPSDKILQLALEKLVGWEKDTEKDQKEEDSDKKTDIISKLVDKLGNEPTRPQETSKGTGSDST